MRAGNLRINLSENQSKRTVRCYFSAVGQVRNMYIVINSIIYVSQIKMITSLSELNLIRTKLQVSVVNMTNFKIVLMLNEPIKVMSCSSTKISLWIYNSSTWFMESKMILLVVIKMKSFFRSVLILYQ